MNIEEIKVLIDIAKKYAPVIKEASEELTNEYSPILADLFEKFRKYSVQSTIKTIEEYREAGFSKKESILLTINSKHALGEIINKINTSNKK